MKKVLFSAIIALLGLTGCSSTNGFFGLATTKYVDRKLEEQGARIDYVDQKNDESNYAFNEALTGNQKLIDEAIIQLASLDGKVEIVRTKAQAIDDLIIELVALKNTTNDLMKYTEQLQIRMNKLPKETLMELIQVLQSYLSSHDVKVSS